MDKFIKVILMIVLVVSVSSCGKKKNDIVQEKKLPLVKTKIIESGFFEEKYKIIGVVKPYESAKLSSEEGGLITQLSKDKGSRVSRGEVVIRLKKDVDEAAYEQALAQYEMAKETFERTTRLYNEQVATEQQYTTAKLGLDVALKSVELYKTRLGKGYIVSPISGIVDAKYMNRGEMTSPGMPILNIVDISRVKISCGIPERYITRISKGDPVEVTFDAVRDEKFEARINYVSPTINPQNRTFEVELVISNTNGLLKPEMSANIIFTNIKIDDAIVLDQDYIVDNGNEKFVFVLEGYIAKKRLLKPGGRSDNKVMIEEGLKSGETLIYVGFQGLNDGDKVAVNNN